MIRTQADSTGDFSASDSSKRKQIRRESKVEWSDRLLNTSSSGLSMSQGNGGATGRSGDSKLKEDFFSLLMEDSSAIEDFEVADVSKFLGTTGQKFSLNKQEEKKKNVEFGEYEVSTKDFGSAKVEVQVVSDRVLLVMHIEKFMPNQHTQILQRLVASRLSHQFGKIFEVEIKCKI